MDIRKIDGVSSQASIKEAWAMMRENSIRTLPVLNEQKLEGIITIGDIANSYMELYDSYLLSDARTQYRSIMNTLDGEDRHRERACIFRERKSCYRSLLSGYDGEFYR